MILALDLGSTSFKAGLFDPRLRLIAERRAPVRHHYRTGGRIELDVADAEQALRRILPRRQPLTAIAITSQAQTFTVADRNGRARRPFVSWQDNRAVAAAAHLKRALPDFAAHSSFAEIWPALQISQIAHQPIPRQQIALSLPSYFVRQWTGLAVTDDNLAAMTGLYSLQENAWWPAALRAARLREPQLPRVLPMGAIAGLTIHNRFGLPVGVPVVLAGNDQTAGAYGARLEQRNATLITLGTAQVTYRCLSRLPPPRNGLIRGPYPGGRFYRMAADAWGGNLINWAQTIFTGCATVDEFFAQAARAPAGCRGLQFDPDSGQWRGWGLHLTPPDFARAILETLSQRMAQLTARLGAQPRQQFLIAGGGSLRPNWPEILAVRLRRPLQITRATPLLGAARLAAAACAAARR